MTEIVSSAHSSSDVPRITQVASSGTSQEGLRCPACQHISRPGELLCSACGKLLVEGPKFNLASTNLLEANAEETFKCPGCLQPCGAGSLVCSHCGKLFSTADDTTDMDRRNMLEPHLHWPAGEVSVEEDQAILVEIDGNRLPLPIAPAIVLGRYQCPPDPSDLRPHVDLTPFNAQELGVSRQHVKITRKYGLIYICDLGSSNGTILNSSLLIPHTDRVIRSGDEVRLGQFKLRIIFPPSMNRF